MMAKPYGLWKRGGKNGIYYFRLGGGPWRSTGCSRQDQATDFALARLEKARAEASQKAEQAAAGILRTYLEPFYCWGRCPHIARLLAEKKQISPQHAKNQRALLERYVLKDPIADKNLAELRRGDILDFRGRMLAKVSDSQANRVVGVLKTCIKEGVYREEIVKDPTLGVGNIHLEARERGVFTADELRRLFPAEGLGPWGSLQAFACFLVAATVGLRRGEILALRWRDLDFDKLQLHVRQAWKDDTTLGPPKWGKVREELPLPELTARRLRELRGASLHVLPPSLVFHEADGSRKPALWWREAFTAAMVKVKIPAGPRRLTAHSFRHSLNTLLRDGGVPAEKIRAVMGWTNEKTQDGYTHFHGEHLRGQAELIDKLLS